jgi:uncharacterized protein (DUF4415 family)
MNDDFHTNWAEQSNHADSANTTTAFNPQRSHNAAPVKQIVTIRLDVDTLNWFKAAGPGYQTRINQLLRDHMEAQLRQERAAA